MTSKNAFKPIDGNRILLDFSSCEYLGEIHQILKTGFGLPDSYGENWDALWDCLDGLFDERGNFQVDIRGFLSLENELRDYCTAMLDIFDRVHKETPNITFTLIS